MQRFAAANCIGVAEKVIYRLAGSVILKYCQIIERLPVYIEIHKGAGKKHQRSK
jgi:hypothetical protein